MDIGPKYSFKFLYHCLGKFPIVLLVFGVYKEITFETFVPVWKLLLQFLKTIQEDADSKKSCRLGDGLIYRLREVHCPVKFPILHKYVEIHCCTHRLLNVYRPYTYKYALLHKVFAVKWATDKLCKTIQEVADFKKSCTLGDS